VVKRHPTPEPPLTGGKLDKLRHWAETVSPEPKGGLVERKKRDGSDVDEKDRLWGNQKKPPQETGGWVNQRDGPGREFWGLRARKARKSVGETERGGVTPGADTKRTVKETWERF